MEVLNTWHKSFWITFKINFVCLETLKLETATTNGVFGGKDSRERRNKRIWRSYLSFSWEDNLSSQHWKLIIVGWFPAAAFGKEREAAAGQVDIQVLPRLLFSVKYQMLGLCL